MTKAQFAKELSTLWEESFKFWNLRSGFQSTGVFPLHFNKFPETAYNLIRFERFKAGEGIYSFKFKTIISNQSYTQLLIHTFYRINIITVTFKYGGEVPATKLAALQKVLQSDFLNAVREVYEHVYETVDIQGSQDIRASATAKATVAAFAASEGHAHPRVVELPKTEEGLGFNVMGGKEQNSPIYISRIIPGGVADRHGGLKRGDQLLSVNGVSVEGENHEKAVELLKQAQGSVKLVVRYTPKVLEEMEMRFDKQRAARRRQFQ
uniref:PDZ domain-containing protein n=1 Tax=Timema cristinae TaxID=61476 RepID=A0A7R9CX25_TIMCR|nr:unnamed protein product [Timema cristinae]